MSAKRKRAQPATPGQPAKPEKPSKPEKPRTPEHARPPATRPADPATLSQAGVDDKRDTERIQILGELHGEVMAFQHMAVREISRGGAQVETRFPLQLDSLHDFRLTLGDRSVVVKGRVAHISISDVDQELVTYRSGIEFIEPSDRVHAVIAEFIDAIKGGRRAQ